MSGSLTFWYPRLQGGKFDSSAQTSKMLDGRISCFPLCFYCPLSGAQLSVRNRKLRIQKVSPLLIRIHPAFSLTSLSSLSRSEVTVIDTINSGLCIIFRWYEMKVKVMKVKMEEIFILIINPGFCNIFKWSKMKVKALDCQIFSDVVRWKWKWLKWKWLSSRL